MLHQKNNDGKDIHILTEIGWLTKASLIARETAVESRRRQGSGKLAYPRWFETPAKVHLFFVLKCHCADMSRQTSFLICDLEIALLRICDLYITHLTLEASRDL